ncbi:MAG: hypothetical protein Q4D62_08135 [Planctomycetia bacterium]|nr:hypothetical protein [Planctomycetia bacterium]
MPEKSPIDNAFMKLFSVVDKLRENVLLATSSKEDIDWLESLTMRQTKALCAVLVMTENKPEGVSLKQLAQRLNTTVPATSVLVEAMVQSKIFLRIPSSSDRRAVCIKPSAFGKNIFDSLRQKMSLTIENLMGDLPEAEKEIFVHVIEQFYNKLFVSEEGM